MHCSSGRAPQKLQFSPSPLMRGLLDAQVPSNFPSFFAHILIAIPANPKASNSIAIKASFILSLFGTKLVKLLLKTLQNKKIPTIKAGIFNYKMFSYFFGMSFILTPNPIIKPIEDKAITKIKIVLLACG